MGNQSIGFRSSLLCQMIQTKRVTSLSLSLPYCRAHKCVHINVELDVLG